MKLELKHLIFYTPYKTKVASITEKGTLLNHGTLTVVSGFITSIHTLLRESQYKIVLQTVDKFSEYIQEQFLNYNQGKEYNKEVINLFCYEFTGTDSPITEIELTTLPMATYSYLLENHVDVFNLIPNNLAIDKDLI